MFGVALKRLGYFFQDRDIELYDSGVKKRIFHVVKAHQRPDGTIVPMHFRGQREFSWADCHVKITVPGLEHVIWNEYNAPTVDEDWQKEHAKEKTLTMPEFGDVIVESIERGWDG